MPNSLFNCNYLLSIVNTNFNETVSWWWSQ